MRIVYSSLALVAAVALPVSARADGATGSSTFTLSHDTSASGPAGRARSLAAQGKCEAALDAFDEALRHTYDPTIYRDRGACHDNLGHLFPAIDDYRAYLTAAPSAPDADAIRLRLDQLETQVPDAQKKLGGGGDYEYEMRGGQGFKSEQKRPEKTDEEQQKEDKLEASGKPLHQIEYDEKRDREAAGSPLRNGKGPILGLFGLGRWWSDQRFQAAQNYGLALRYSLSAVSTLLGEVSYVNVNASGTASQMGGFGVGFGYEARVALDHWASNHLLFGAIIEYENTSQGSSGISFSSFLTRGRIGYRHTFGSSIGLEFLADGGSAVIATDSGVAVSALIGGTVAFLVGF